MPKFSVTLPVDLPPGALQPLVGMPVFYRNRPVGTVESAAVASGGYELTFDLTDPGFKLVNDIRFSIGTDEKGGTT